MKHKLLLPVRVPSRSHFLQHYHKTPNMSTKQQSSVSSQGTRLPTATMRVLAMCLPVIAIVLWIAAGSAGVGAMNAYKTAATESNIANVGDLQAIADHLWTGQVVSLVCSVLLAVGFGVLSWWVWGRDARNETDTKLNLNMVVGVFGLLLCVATTAALIDGMTDLNILAETQAASGATGGTVMVTESETARSGSIALLSIGLAATFAAGVAVFVIRKRGNYYRQQN